MKIRKKLADRPSRDFFVELLISYIGACLETSDRSNTVDGDTDLRHAID